MGETIELTISKVVAQTEKAWLLKFEEADEEESFWIPAFAIIDGDPEWDKEIHVLKRIAELKGLG